MTPRVVFIFLDGVGLGAELASNPFFNPGLPYLESLTGSKLLSENAVTRQDLIFKGIDACLGIPGLPQSATGQTTLFTGINAAAYLGYHYPAFPDEKLKKIIDEHSLLKRVVEQGQSACFANAYTPQYFALVKEGKRTHSVTTLSVYAAGIPFKYLYDLKRGEAVYWDMTNSYLITNRGLKDLNLIRPEQAGKNLAGISSHYHLTVFECFLPDLIGHKRDKNKAVQFVRDFDSFCCGLFENVEKNTTIIISSDHGNMEDLQKAGHTTNPVIFFAKGNKLAPLHSIDSITQVSTGILQILTERL